MTTDAATQANSNGGSGGAQNPSTTQTPPNQTQQTQQPNQQTQQNQQNQPNSDEIARLTARVDELTRTNTSLTNENASLAESFRDLVIELAPPEKRAKIEGLLEQLETKYSDKKDSDTIEERARNVYIREKVLEFGAWGVTADDFKDAKTVDEVDVIAARRKADFLEAKLNEKPNPGQVNSDKGGGGLASPPAPKIEGRGRDAVAAHIGAFFKANRGTVS